MSVSVANPKAAFIGSTLRTGSTSRPALLRTLLLAGCMASMAIALWLGPPPASVQADPELARLLRGMALIKGGIVLAAVCALMWRFGRPAPQRLAAAYLAGTWLAAGASMLIWQLTLIPWAALAFHAGELTLLVAAWRDRRSD